MHNLGTVIRFEVSRTLKKKSFWIAALAVPLVVGLVAAIIYFSNKTTDEVTQNLTKEKFSLGVTDDAHLVSPVILKAVGAKTFPSEEAGKQAVRQGKIDAYFFYPADISKSHVRVYGKEVGLFQNSRYEGMATQLLRQSVGSVTSPNVRAILQGQVQYDSTTYAADGQVDKGFYKLIAPGLFLVLFYFMIATFGNQILTSVTEEKENRVIEMILATIKPTTLIVGKLFSLVALALIQMIVIIVPVLVGYFALRHQLTLPNLDISQIPLDPLRITLGAVIFLVSFLMFASVLMTIGAAMPTAKEAGSFFGAVIALVFGPLYAAPLFVSSPDSGIVQFLSYFPLTAPIPLLLRNAVGNLSLLQAIIALAILIVTTAFAIRIGIRIFRFGALEYSRRLSLKEVLARKA